MSFFVNFWDSFCPSGVIDKAEEPDSRAVNKFLIPYDDFFKKKDGKQVKKRNKFAPVKSYFSALCLSHKGQRLWSQCLGKDDDFGERELNILSFFVTITWGTSHLFTSVL